jgi:hypothetical protein
LFAIAVTLCNACYTAPLTLEDRWLSARALLFAGFIGVTLWLGIRAESMRGCPSWERGRPRPPRVRQ